ncbi:MAG: hypothetical protein MJE68_12145, partial [Proteobacteria bacterium]|nr:hypothetical protein [Pseudomonadota bacterium]
ASETTFTSKKIDYWTKVTSIIMIVGKFQGGISPGSPSLNKSLQATISLQIASLEATDVNK